MSAHVSEILQAVSGALFPPPKLGTGTNVRQSLPQDSLSDYDWYRHDLLGPAVTDTCEVIGHKFNPKIHVRVDFLRIQSGEVTSYLISTAIDILGALHTITFR